MHIIFIIIAFFCAWLGGHALDWIFNKISKKFGNQANEESLEIIELSSLKNLNRLTLPEPNNEEKTQEFVYFFKAPIRPKKQEFHENQPFTPAK